MPEPIVEREGSTAEGRFTEKPAEHPPAIYARLLLLTTSRGHKPIRKYRVAVRFFYPPEDTPDGTHRPGKRVGAFFH